MSSDPIAEMVGGDGALMAIVGLVCLIACLPGGWTMIFRAIGALLSGIVLGAMAFIGWAFWHAWTLRRWNNRAKRRMRAKEKPGAVGLQHPARKHYDAISMIEAAAMFHSRPGHHGRAGRPAARADKFSTSTWSSNDGQFLESLGFDRDGRRTGGKK